MDQHSKDMYEQVCKPQLDELKAAAHESNLRIEKKLDSLTNAILGNGKAGLTTRVTLVEQAQDGDKWRWRLVIGLTGTLAIKLAYDVISSHIL